MDGTYSLWFMPVGDTRTELSRIISELSVEYAFPPFHPHVTLVGELRGSKQVIVSKALRLSESIGCCSIHLTELTHSNEFYRSLFIKVGKTPALDKAHRLAKEMFDLPARSHYQPHLSLMYGLQASHLKKMTIMKLGKEFPTGFLARSISLVSTDGQVPRWHEVEEIPLFPPG